MPSEPANAETSTPPQPRRSGAKWWMLALAGLVLFGVSIYYMAQRIAAYNTARHFTYFHAETVVSRDFQLEGWPPGRLEDFADENGRHFLRLTFGGAETLIPVKEPPALAGRHSTTEEALAASERMGLALYDEWVKVMALNRVEPVTDPDAKSGRRLVAVPGSERLWVITRSTPPGYDPASWGSVRRTEWVFSFYDLKKDGSVEVFHRRWPRKQRGEKFLQERAASGAPEDARYAALAAIPPLEERSTEYYAAMHVIPKLNVPKQKFEDTAFSFRTLSWTAPGAGFGALAMIFGVTFALGARAEKKFAWRR